jgi:hypothetical protein
MRYVRFEKYFSKGDYQKKSSEASEARAFVLAASVAPGIIGKKKRNKPKKITSVEIM